VSRRVRRPKARKGVSKQKINPTRNRFQKRGKPKVAGSRVIRRKVQGIKERLEENERNIKFMEEKPHLFTAGEARVGKIADLQRTNEKLRAQLKKLTGKKTRKKKTTRPKPQLTPAQRRAVLAERELAPGKRRKRAALKRAREDLPPSFVDEGFEMFSVGSSNLSAVGYKERLKIMRVHFIGGNVYDYFGVPEFVYLSILEQGTSKGGAGSAGKALHQQVKVFTPQYEKTIYTYRKVR
jgi:hypothetical protein